MTSKFSASSIDHGILFLNKNSGPFHHKSDCENWSNEIPRVPQSAGFCLPST